MQSAKTKDPLSRISLQISLRNRALGPNRLFRFLAASDLLQFLPEKITILFSDLGTDGADKRLSSRNGVSGGSTSRAMVWRIVITRKIRERHSATRARMVAACSSQHLCISRCCGRGFRSRALSFHPLAKKIGAESVVCFFPLKERFLHSLLLNVKWCER